MITSRFWYGVIALVLGVAAYLLFLSTATYNHAGSRAMSEALAADSSAVDWFLRDDARKRSSALIPIALSPELIGALGKVSDGGKVEEATRTAATTALKKLGDDVPADLKFDALWAVDATGRVIGAQVTGGAQLKQDADLGGYAVVADALHGWIRDDAWVWGNRIYRVVARPVEREAGGEPVGAIVGAKIVDDAFASAVTKRTGAAVGFFADNARVASGAPEGFNKASLDEVTRDLKYLDTNKDYQEKGRSEVRVLNGSLGVVYARLPGEAWDLGAGYAVGRVAFSVNSPLEFSNQADASDKAKVPTLWIVLAVLGLALLGLLFTVLEHSRPLGKFRHEAARLAKGEIDALKPSELRGVFKKIAADINDGIEKAAVKGGGSRRAADLEQVLGPIPAQPMMSAFSVPGAGGPAESPSGPSRPIVPRAASEKTGAARSRVSDPSAEPTPLDTSGPSAINDTTRSPSPVQAPPPAPHRPPPAPKREAPPPPVQPEAEFNELDDWRRVYEEFLGLKRQCGEPTDTLTFEKFKGTLQRNKDALVARHNCSRVKFTVYVKEGKAALKASPVK
ncbi:MAG: MXAN_5187 family protein [Byssovorax sp.]